MLSKELLDILCCPLDHGDLTYFPDQNLLKCNICKKEFKIENDIPIMIIDENEISR